MLRDVYWRQYPIDLLSDDKMACVEAMLPDEQKHIPYMIYIAALKLCDDNGVFDIDDGVVLARLTRVKDVQIIFNVVNLMRQRKILYRLFDQSTLCGLVDWTYADKKPRTIDERRKLVAEKIQKEQARAGVDKDFTLPGTQAAPMQQQYTAPAASTAAPVQEAETAPAPQDFLCAKNDKNAKNVVISGMDDKNAKNVDTLQYNTVQDNKTEQTDNTNIQTNTHTIQQAPGYALPEGAPPDACQNTKAVGLKIQTPDTENSNINTSENVNCDNEISKLAEMAWNESRSGGEEKDTGQLEVYLNDFFVKNCYGAYKKELSGKAIKALISEILALSDDVNPPETVASVLCSEFKKLCEGQREKYWQGTPMLPAYMIKPRILAEIIQYAGKILATAQNEKKFLEAAKKAQEESEKDKELVYDAVREEYVKYNIDPEDPNAQKLLLMAKSREAEAARKAENEEFEIF